MKNTKTENQLNQMMQKNAKMLNENKISLGDQLKELQKTYDVLNLKFVEYQKMRNKETSTI